MKYLLILGLFTFLFSCAAEVKNPIKRTTSYVHHPNGVVCASFAHYIREEACMCFKIKNKQIVGLWHADVKLCIEK